MSEERQQAQEMVSRDILEIYHGAQAQLQAAQAAAQFVTNQITAKYSLTAEDKVDLATGAITRGQQPAESEGGA